LKKNLNNPDSRIKHVVICALELRKDTASSLILSKQIENEDYYLNQYSPESWKDIKNSHLIDKLINDLEDNDWKKRNYAAQVFIYNKDERAVDSLIKVLSDGGDKEIYELKENLKSTESDISSFKLDMLQNEIHKCHYNAALALVYIGNEKALKALGEMSRDKREPYRAVAAQVLGWCPNKDAVGLLTSLVKDESEYVRSAVLESLGKQKTSEAIKTLKDTLKDKNPENRATAIKVLGELKDTSLKEVYISIVANEEDGSVTVPVIQALSNCEVSPEINNALIKRIFIDNSDYNPFEMRFAVEVLKAKKTPTVIKTLEKKLQSNNEVIRAKASKVLGELGDTSSIPVLQKHLTDEDYVVRIYAAEALSHFNDPKLLDDLIKAAKNTVPFTNEGAVKALGNYKEKEVIQILTRFAKQDEDFEVRIAAINSLSKISDSSSLDIFLNSLNDKDEYVRKAAVIALGKINTPQTTEALIDVLNTEVQWTESSSNWEVIDAAAVALEKSTDPDLKQKLLGLLDSKNYQGRIEAVRLLVLRGWKPSSLDEWIKFDIAAGLFDVVHEKGSAAVEPLIAATEETDWRWKGGAAKALGKIGDERAIGPLIRVLKSENWPRQEAAKSLKQFADDRAIEPLINALNDWDWHMRVAVADALGAYDQPKVTQALKKATQDPHPRVKEAALKSLN
jgi:HEAT repeat protein